MMEQRVLKMKDVKIREESGSRYLDGYFAIFGQSYNVFDGWVETIAPGAFARTLAGGGDVKALWNHDSNIVLGSTSNHTLTLSGRIVSVDWNGISGHTERRGKQSQTLSHSSEDF